MTVSLVATLDTVDTMMCTTQTTVAARTLQMVTTRRDCAQRSVEHRLHHGACSGHLLAEALFTLSVAGVGMAMRL